MKKIEIVLKNILLRLLLLFNSVDKNNGKIDLSKNSKILFVRLNKIGDALVTTPLLKYIKEETGCHISVLADIKNHFVFNDNKVYDEILIFKKGFKEFRNILRKINRTEYDVIVDLHDDISTTVSFLMASVKCKYKVALNKGNENLYNCLVPKLNPAETHVIERVMKFAEIFELKIDADVNIHYPLFEKSIDYADQFLNGIEKNKFTAGINISAGNEARFWGVERFKKVISLFEKFNLNIIILSTDQEREYAEEISGGKYNVFTSPNFNQFAAVISKLDFLFTPDTSTVHLASAYEIPMFGIYVKYNTSNMIWYPFKSDYDCVITREPNFKNLEFDSVKEKLQTFLEKIYEQRNT